MRFIRGIGEGAAEGVGIEPGGAVTLSVVSTERGRYSVLQRTCCVVHMATIPSSMEALVLLALTNKSSKARVMGEGGSLPNDKPYFVAVISKNCISRRVLFSAEMSRSMVRYMGWNCEFCVWGSRILARSWPMKRM